MNKHQNECRDVFSYQAIILCFRQNDDTKFISHNTFVMKHSKYFIVRTVETPSLQIIKVSDCSEHNLSTATILLIQLLEKVNGKM